MSTTIDRSKINQINNVSINVDNAVQTNIDVATDSATNRVRAIESVSTAGNRHIYSISRITINPEEEQISISIREFIKTPENSEFLENIAQISNFTDRELLIDKTRYCLASDRLMTSLDRSITHDADGNVKEGYVTLWDSFMVMMGNNIFALIQQAMYNRVNQN